MSAKTNQPQFAPQLFINNGVKDISFYTNAFGTTENLCFYNDDGSIHVAELSIDGAIFYVHEVMQPTQLSPNQINGTTTLIALFVDDVDAVMQQAMAAGAVEISAAQDYDYGYRQGEIKDPFGHYWMIQKRI